MSAGLQGGAIVADKTQSSRNAPSPDNAEGLNRRAFLASATGAAAGAAFAGAAPAAAQTAGAEPPERAAPPSGAQLERERFAPDDYTHEERDRYFVERPGSDFMVDVIKSLGIDYIAANPGSSFRGLHESLVNYGGNTRPELLTCLHEEHAVAIGQGYF